MGLFSFLTRTKSLNSNERAWAFLLGVGSPAGKSLEYLNAYKSWVYACTSAIADEVATIEFRIQQKNGDTWKDIQTHHSPPLRPTQALQRCGIQQSRVKSRRG